MSIRVIQGEQFSGFNLLWLLDGREVRYETGLSDRSFRPWLGIEATGDARPTVQVNKLVELRYSATQ